MTPLSALYERYERIKIRSRRPSTKRLYRITLELFDRHLGRPAVQSDLNDDTVSAFAVWRAASGVSKKTVNRDLANLLALWRWLHHLGEARNWPQVELEVPPKRVPVALLREEVARVMLAIELESMPVAGVPGPLFWKALIMLLWNTAERIGAIMSLEWDAIDLERGWVRFDAEGRKGGVEDNALPISPETCEALKLIRRGREKVFHWPYHRTYIFYRLGKILTRAGIPKGRMYKFHLFRKTVASYYEAAGGNATALLKHSSRKVTECYLDPRICKVPAPIDLLFRPGE